MSERSLEDGLQALRKQIDAPVAAFFSSCVRCGLCAEACLFHQETGDPTYTPIHKLEPLRRIWRNEFTLLGKIGASIGLLKTVDDALLEAWEPLVYDSCTLCGRCSLVCPVGNDITLMVRKLREGMSASGHAPQALYDAAERHLEHGSPMGDLGPALKAQVRNAEAETGIAIALDRTGADYLVILSAQETAVYPEIIPTLARLFKQADVSWTISSACFEATNVGVQIGNAAIARAIVSRVVDAAEALQVKTVIAPECGHAYQALRWEGPNLIGRPYGFTVVHIVELLDRLLREGRIHTKGKDQRRLTLHDPCQIVRRGGIEAEPRRLLSQVAADVHEGHDQGRWNWCCGGGGGVGANPRAADLRAQALKLKRRQFVEAGAQGVVTLCAFCRHTLEDGMESLDMDTEVLSLAELLADYLDD